MLNVCYYFIIRLVGTQCSFVYYLIRDVAGNIYYQILLERSGCFPLLLANRYRCFDSYKRPAERAASQLKTNKQATDIRLDDHISTKMTLMPYWLRPLRNLSYRDPLLRILEEPFAVIARDPFFRASDKYIRGVTTPLEQEHDFKEVHSDSEIKVDGKKVEVHLDVQNFTPEQIEVKTVGNEIMIEGKKEIKREDGWTRSHFERRFLLPKGFPPERVECHLDKGKLKLVAFRAEPLEERKIPIQEKSKSDESL